MHIWYDECAKARAPRHVLQSLSMIGPILMQFGTKDRFVSNDAASAQADAVTGPKTVKTYEAEHELTAAAMRDRIEWLNTQLKLGR